MSRELGVLFAVTLVRVGAAQAPAHTATHIRAAERLLEVVDLEQVMAQGIDAMLKAQIQQTPQLAPYEDILRQFLAKHMSWAALKGDLITVYMDAFTEAELDQPSR